MPFQNLTFSYLLMRSFTAIKRVYHSVHKRNMYMMNRHAWKCVCKASIGETIVKEINLKSFSLAIHRKKEKCFQLFDFIHYTTWEKSKVWARHTRRLRIELHSSGCFTTRAHDAHMKSALHETRRVTVWHTWCMHAAHPLLFFGSSHSRLTFASLGSQTRLRVREKTESYYKSVQ